MAYQGEVRVDTRVTTDNIKKDLAKAEREIAKISKAFDSTTASVRKQEIALSDLQRKYDALMEGQKTPASLSAMQTSLRNTEREIREVEKANKDLFAQYEAAAQRAEALRPFGETDEQFIKAQEQADILFQRLEPIEQKFAELNAKAQDLRQSIAGVKMTPETSLEAQHLADKIKLTTDNLNKSHGEAASLEMDLKLATAEAERLKGALGESGGAESAKASIDGIGQAAQTAAQMSMGAFKKIGSLIGGIAKGAGKSAKGILGMAKNIFTLGASSNKASGGVNGLFKRLLQLGAAAFVFNVLRKGLRELSDSIRGLLMANQEFASAWNNIRVNMITAFAPLWEVLEPAIVKFMQLLAQFTAVLAQFMALLFGKTYTQARASAKALNDQSKALKGVGGAAEKASKQLQGFDQINRLAAESGGGGAGAEGLDFDFEVPDASWIDEFAEKFKNFFKEADFEYWFNLGALAAQKFADALNKIPWDSIRKGARIAGENLAGLLGGFLSDKGIHEAVGRFFAQLFNTVLDFSHSFATNFPWRETGLAIASGINKFFTEFDFALLGQTLSVWALGLLSLFIGVLQETDWRLIGESIRELLVNIDWAGIWESVKEAIGLAFTGFRELLIGIFDSEGAADALIIVLTTLAAIIGTVTIATGIMSVATTAFGVAMALLTSPIGLVALGITALIAIITALILNWDTVKETAGNAWKFIQEKWQAAPDWFKNIASGIGLAFTMFIDNIKNNFLNLWEFVSGIIGKIGSAIGGLIEKISGAKSSASSISVGAASGRSLGISPAAQSFSSEASPAASFSSDALSSILSPAIGNIAIPKLSRNGIIDTATMSMISEKGRTASTAQSQSAGTSSAPANNNDNNAEMLSLLRELLAAVRKGQTLEVNGATLARVVNNSQTNSFRQAGRTLIPL